MQAQIYHTDEFWAQLNCQSERDRNVAKQFPGDSREQIQIYTDDCNTKRSHPLCLVCVYFFKPQPEKSVRFGGCALEKCVRAIIV